MIYQPRWWTAIREYAEGAHVSLILRNNAEEFPFLKPQDRPAQEEIIVIKKSWRYVTSL